MTRPQTLIIIVIVGLFTSAATAQKCLYNVIMKDVASAAGSLRKGLAGGDLIATAADADKLERLFRETEDFWTPFRTKDAIDAARGAREVSSAITAAAKGNELQKAQTAASGLGRFFYDVAGNVWEWTSDWYERDYYSVSPDRNPPGPSTGDYRVTRGGGWTEGVQMNSFRNYADPELRTLIIGFRCAMSAGD